MADKNHGEEIKLFVDGSLYGQSFVDEQGRRIDPKTLEPWCDMDLPDFDYEDWGTGDVFHHEDGSTR